ncbi:FAD:protein FMN transferase [uncultured Paracoccus sp.]|uniref:FAD:protein FMN transferase n=1 Tax=uncultured Paracoccus sp. TaxID=189685 RepID=UPI002595E0EE|nr:FAD:protein FMN transferase [uncultured Paracoccus sp.]
MNRRRFLLVTACAALPARAWAAPQEWRGRAMGADVTLRLRGASPTQARSFFGEAARVLAHVESLFSLHRDSDLTRLNRDGRLRFPASGMIELLTLSGRLHEATGGAFDPTVQPLWVVRARGEDETTARTLVGWDAVRWSRTEVRLTRPGMALTFNGLAQGWAADRLAGAAVRHDLTDLLIDTGEIRALGTRRWPVTLADTAGAAYRRIRLCDRAVATSSPAGTLIGPRGLPHILAPGGGGVLWDTISVSAATAAMADGLSTALCLMQPDVACGALRRLPGCRIELAVPAQDAEFSGKMPATCHA